MRGSSRHELSRRALATDQSRLEQLFGTSDVLPLWIAEPYLPVAQPVREALERRAASGWFGYESRPPSVKGAFWDWMSRRHGWAREGLSTMISPSVGTSIGVLIDQFSDEGDGVIIQPPVFTDFKPLITASNRTVVRSPLVLDGDRYSMDLEHLAAAAADPSVRVMILCNPHNPVGRAWATDDLRAVAEICVQQGVTVIADEIHADLVLPPLRFTPFAEVAAESGVRWAALHGPIKTFGLAGLCDTLLITDDDEIASRFRSVSNRLHLTRNNVFALEAFETAYRAGEEWLDDLLDLVAANVRRLTDGLDAPLRVMPHEATYLAWIDFRGLGLDVPELAGWLAESGLAFSPGHWFGRQGAGFARMSIAVESEAIDTAIERLNTAVGASG